MQKNTYHFNDVILQTDIEIMSEKIILELPEGSFSALRKNPDEFAREMLYAALCKWYEKGMISQSKAVEIARISRQEFLDILKKYEVSPFQYTGHELQKELS